MRFVRSLVLRDLASLHVPGVEKHVALPAIVSPYGMPAIGAGVRGDVVQSLQVFHREQGHVGLL
jgi:hypothetical protein